MDIMYKRKDTLKSALLRLDNHFNFNNMYLANIILSYLSISLVEKYDSNQYFIKNLLVN